MPSGSGMCRSDFRLGGHHKLHPRFSRLRRRYWLPIFWCAAIPVRHLLAMVCLVQCQLRSRSWPSFADCRLPGVSFGVTVCSINIGANSICRQRGSPRRRTHPHRHPLRM